MKLTGNTIIITGGGSGIGLALALALQERGNQVVIAGRRPKPLADAARNHPGLDTLELDVSDPKSIAAAARILIERHPSLNVLVNNAGVMTPDDVSGTVPDELLTSTVATNLLGPIRMTSALIGHLKRQPCATVINVTSGLAFTPLAAACVYSATKAALHSYTLSLRHRLRKSAVRVLELAPPYVQTDLTPGQATATAAMPLADYIREAVGLLETDADEILVERVRRQRENTGPHELAFVREFNELREAAH